MLVIIVHSTYSKLSKWRILCAVKMCLFYLILGKVICAFKRPPKDKYLCVEYENILYILNNFESIFVAFAKIIIVVNFLLNFNVCCHYIRMLTDSSFQLCRNVNSVFEWCPKFTHPVYSFSISHYNNSTKVNNYSLLIYIYCLFTIDVSIYLFIYKFMCMCYQITVPH